MTPDAFTTLKQKIESSTILSDTEKKEWLYLLPRMNDEQAKELDRILSVKLPVSPSPSPSPQPSTAVPSPARGEGNKEKTIARHPLPPMRHVVALPIKHMDIPVSRGERIHREAVRNSPLSSLTSREGVAPQASPLKVRGDSGGLLNSNFASLTLADLQAAPSVFTFLEGLNSQAQNKLAARTATTEQIVADFEKSPLHDAYVQTGVALMAGKAGKLTREQFEALADFGASLKKLY